MTGRETATAEGDADETGGDHGHEVPLARARSLLAERVSPIERTERIPLSAADGRVLAAPATAERAVPHYARAAMDGYAVRHADVADATAADPAVLTVVEDAVEPGTAVPVHTGSELPEGADTVVRIERTRRPDRSPAPGETVAVVESVPEGKDVAPVGEDVPAGRTLFEAGRRLSPADLGVLRSVGRTNVAVYDRPSVAVVPTGEELVAADPEPGEVVETNGLTVAALLERWGADPTRRPPVTDDHGALTRALERAADRHDLVVTSGGSSVGDRDLLPDVVGDLGEVFVDGVAIKPGHPVTLGVVAETPVACLPGYPVSCLVCAVQLLRPAVKRAGRLPADPVPTTEAVLEVGIDSDPGTRRFSRVHLDARGGGPAAVSHQPSSDDRDLPVARETDDTGAGILSSVTRTDGWVQVPEGATGFDEGDAVTVEFWDRLS